MPRPKDLIDTAPMPPDDQKFRELILYICEVSEGDEPFGATKLNKLLFLSDFEAYLAFGKPITGQEYQAQDQGPVPRRLPPIMREMTENDEIATRPHSYFGQIQKKSFALRDPDLRGFNAAEIALVDAIIRQWWGRTATEISLASHQFVGWRFAEKGETIPYQSMLVDTRKPTDDERRRGKELEARALELLSGHGG